MGAARRFGATPLTLWVAAGAVLVLLILLGPATRWVPVVVLLVSIVAVGIRAQQRRSIEGWGIVLIVSFTAIMLGGLLLSLVPGDGGSRPTEQVAVDDVYTPRSASHNTPINANCPIIGLEGLLGLVEVVEKLKEAAHTTQGEVGQQCPKEQFPPACKPRLEPASAIMVEAAADEPPSGAGEPQPLASVPTRRAREVHEGGGRRR
jgi:hypothetical protein